MANQLPKSERNSFDNWSVNTHYIFMIPTFGFPVLIIWFAFYYSRWYVQHKNTEFYRENYELIKRIFTIDKPLPISIGSESDLQQDKRV